jgi:hypothetical protein
MSQNSKCSLILMKQKTKLMTIKKNKKRCKYFKLNNQQFRMSFTKKSNYKREMNTTEILNSTNNTNKSC